MAGYREDFGRALEAIEAKVIEAFAMIAEAGVLTTLVERQREIDAWYQRDRAAMDVLVVQDADLDELCAGAIAELASGVMTVPVTIELTLVARSCERLGDHAVNVAGRVAYLAGSVSS